MYEEFMCIRDFVCNKIIQFLLKYSNVNAGTIYAIGKQCCIDELKFYVKELEKEKQWTENQ